jgi:pyruvate formate lyase activating enzyme
MMLRMLDDRLRLGLEVVALAAFILIGIALIAPTIFSSIINPERVLMWEAMYYTKLDGKRVQCGLCFRRCIIPPGGVGFCRVRKNINGRLYTLVFGKVAALQIDPIEKEPLFHVLSGSRIFCVGTAGCNFRCSFCQNWHLSHMRIEQVKYYRMTPEEIVDLCISHGCDGIHFTYNEPTVFYEYMLAVAKEAKRRGIYFGFHTNGAINPEPLKELLEYTDAVAVDLKAFDDDFYEYVTEPTERFKPSTPPLEAVLRTLRIIREEGVWLEIVYLVIPTLNDDMDEIREMCLWIKENLGEDVPLHFTRYLPACKLTRLPLTPIETLERARETALEVGLKFVYIGNVPGHPGEDLYCPRCGEPLILRLQFTIMEYRLINGRCPSCGYEIPGLWSREQVKSTQPYRKK